MSSSNTEELTLCIPSSNVCVVSVLGVVYVVSFFCRGFCGVEYRVSVYLRCDVSVVVRVVRGAVGRVVGKLEMMMMIVCAGVCQRGC